MNGVGAIVALGFVVSWVLYIVFGLFLPGFFAISLALVYGAVLVWFLRNNIAVSGSIAVLAPFGVLLPALALRHMVVGLGWNVPGFSGLEIGVFLVFYTAFLSSAFGRIPVNIYRLGYAPWPVAAMALFLCIYALLTDNWFLALVVVFSQVVWIIRLGSSNWFDHVTHVLLWPVALISLIGKVI